MANCKYCKQPIKWPDPYTKGDKPLNLDGTKHICPGEKKTPKEEPTSAEKSPELLDSSIGVQVVEQLKRIADKMDIFEAIYNLLMSMYESQG